MVISSRVLKTAIALIELLVVVVSAVLLLPLTAAWVGNGPWFVAAWGLGTLVSLVATGVVVWSRLDADQGQWLGPIRWIVAVAIPVGPACALGVLAFLLLVESAGMRAVAAISIPAIAVGVLQLPYALRRLRLSPPNKPL